MEGNSHGVIYGSNPAFYWGDGRKLRKALISIAEPSFEPETCQIGSRVLKTGLHLALQQTKSVAYLCSLIRDLFHWSFKTVA